MPYTPHVFTQAMLANAAEKKELGLSNKSYVLSLGAAADIMSQTQLKNWPESYPVAKARYDREFNNKIMTLYSGCKFNFRHNIVEASPLLDDLLSSFGIGERVGLLALKSEYASLQKKPLLTFYYCLGDGAMYNYEICKIEDLVAKKLHIR